MTLELVRDFGAVDNALQDNTEALQRLFAMPAWFRERVVMPKSVRFRNPIGIYAPPSGNMALTLAGEGKGMSQLVAMDPTKPAFLIGGGVGHRPVTDVTFERVHVGYESYASVKTTMFVLRNVQTFSMQDCHLTGYRDLFQIGRNEDGNGAPCLNVRLEGVKANPAPEAFHAGERVAESLIRIENVSGLWIEGCMLDAVDSQVGFHFTCRDTVTVDTVHVGGGTLLKDCLTGVRAGDGTASNVFFEGTIFDECTSVGVHLETRPDRELKNWQFTNCWYHSDNFGIIADCRAGGRFTRLTIDGGTMDAARVPFAFAGGVKVNGRLPATT